MKYIKTFEQFITEKYDSINESTKLQKDDANWIYDNYIKDVPGDLPTARQLAYDILMDTDSKIHPGYIQNILKKHKKLDIKMKK